MLRGPAGGRIRCVPAIDATALPKKGALGGRAVPVMRAHQQDSPETISWCPRGDRGERRRVLTDEKQMSLLSRCGMHAVSAHSLRFVQSQIGRVRKR